VASKLPGKVRERPQKINNSASQKLLTFLSLWSFFVVILKSFRLG
jgi:hypothetical protein